jgi:hypothetical protein
MAEGNLAEAKKFYLKGLAMTQHEAKSAPANVGLQGDLVASYGGVGLVFAQQGEATLARDAFYRGRAIAVQLKERVAADDGQLLKQLAAFDSEIAKLHAVEPERVQSQR